MSEEADQRARVVEVARSWVGTPYHHRARIKGAGVDCGQLIAAVFEEAKLIEPVPLENYPPDWMAHRGDPRFQNTLEHYTKKVDREIRPADILLFRYGRGLSHGAIVVEFPIVVHAVMRARAVVLGSLEEEVDLHERLAGVWTLKEWS